MDDNEAPEPLSPVAPVRLSQLITDEDNRELFRELTTILTRRWTKNNVLVFGVSEHDLLIATRMDVVSLHNILEDYSAFIELLGLRLVSYYLEEGDKWYCLKSEYYAPPELSESETLVLGVMIAMIELEQRSSVSVKKVKEFLLTRGYLKEYQVGIIIKSLVKKGYIKRKRGYNSLSYGYRTLIEFEETERVKIKEEFRKLD